MYVLLPFSSVQFFMITIVGAILIYFFKNKLEKYLPYNILIFILTIGYLILFLPNKVYLMVFLFYTYIIYYLFSKKYNLDNILILSLLIALPMILFKLEISPFSKILGISYITFRTVQMIIDSKNYGYLNFIDFTSFLLFPPTILAGPIDRSYRFSKDLEAGYQNINRNNIIDGWELLLLGILIKFVFADLVNLLWMSKVDINSQSLYDMINSAYSYSLFLYFDFAGYSLMAIGLSKMIGINIPKNFDKPFLATNPQLFWRRFHITLGSWLTDYFFKPIYKYLHQFNILKGRRLLIQNISILSTFLLMGIWNGLEWYYIFSGFLFGLYSTIHNMYIFYIKKGGLDYFTLFPNIININLKRFFMINAAIFALYFFSGRIPL